MSYVQRVLQPGEQVRHISSIHWIVLARRCGCNPGGGRLLAQRHSGPDRIVAVYVIRPRFRCGRSPDPAMDPVVGH